VPLVAAAAVIWIEKLLVAITGARFIIFGTDARTVKS